MLNTNIVYCMSSTCQRFDKCRRGLDNNTMTSGALGNNYSVGCLLRDDGTCEVGEK